MGLLMLDPTETQAIQLPFGQAVRMVYQRQRSAWAILSAGKDAYGRRTLLGWTYGPVYLAPCEVYLSARGMEASKYNPNIPFEYYTGILIDVVDASSVAWQKVDVPRSDSVRVLKLTRADNGTREVYVALLGEGGEG